MQPLVSIGVPVYNGEKLIKKCLESLLSQTYSNFEIIISDNASTDSTFSIINSYAANDKRIKCFQQSKNIGSSKNFQFVYEKANGEFFSWNAVDDIKSNDFLEKNINFLLDNKNFIASTSPNCFDYQLENRREHQLFSIDGGVYKRLDTFLAKSWQSHGIFYSVFRKEALADCEYLGEKYIALDWIIDVHLLMKGNISRIKEGLIISGSSGISNSKDPYALFRNKKIEYIFPLYEFSRYYLRRVIKVELGYWKKISLVFKLLILNLSSFKNQILYYYTKLKNA